MTARGGAGASRRELGLPPRGLFPAANFFDEAILGQLSRGEMLHSLMRIRVGRAVPYVRA